jgi:hypothetical protein
MNSPLKAIVFTFFCTLISCNNKTIERIEPESVPKSYIEIFNERNVDRPDMAYPIEYYKNKIIENQQIFKHESEMNEIMEIPDIIPGHLSFLAGWGGDYNTNSFIMLYAFNKKNNFVYEYLVGNKQYINYYSKILIDNLPGIKMNPGLLSVGDFNNDGINEIASYSINPPEHYWVFTVYGYNVGKDEFAPSFSVPVFINFENVFSPVEPIVNGFRILEIVDHDPLELAWNNYIWDTNIMEYVKQ